MIQLEEVSKGYGGQALFRDVGWRIGDGERIGFDLEDDRKRFHVTERGVTLITPERLGQSVHMTR